MTSAIDIREGGLGHPDVVDLLRLHLEQAQANTPARNRHALDVSGLRDPAITFYTAWDSDVLLGIAALKGLDPEHCEVKSMRTTAAAQRRGVARALLGHVLAEARRRGCTRVSLETGTSPAFVPANALYEAFGFGDGPVFGGYPASPHNRFMTLAL